MQDRVYDIVAMLDEFMGQGGGHVNITVDEQSMESEWIETKLSIDCNTQQSACMVPTLHQGIDENEEE